MDSVKGIVDKGGEFAAQNPFDDAIEKAGDLADCKTSGKYADQVDKAQDAVRKALRAE
ncbi:antitoxin [Rhodococcus ruber]